MAKAKDIIRRLTSAVTALVMSAGMMLPTTPSKTIEAATWNDINQSGVFLKQEWPDSCTAAAATMLIRRVAMMRGDPDWYTISEAEVRAAANYDQIGLSWDFTCRGIRIVHSYDLPSGYDEKAAALRDILSRCSEGIIGYDEDSSASYSAHAVLLTDYTDGQFYCCDPAGSVPGGRIPLSSSLVSLDSIDAVWWCTSPIVNLEAEKKIPSKPDLSIKTGSSRVGDPTVLSSSKCSDADQYHYRIYRKGEAEPFIFEKSSDSNISVDLPKGEYYCSIASYNFSNDICTFSDTKDFSVGIGRIEPYKTTTYNGHVYAAYTQNLMYRGDAEKFCEESGGHLATITSAEENAAIASILPESGLSYWLGADDSQKEGTFTWVTGEPFEFTNFAENEPNDVDNEDYLTIYASGGTASVGTWNDSKGNRYKGFILEIEPLSEVATSRYGDSTYSLFEDELNWTEAEEFAKSIGGELVSINDEAEHNFVFDFFASHSNKSSCWVGLRRTESDATFTWADGTKGYIQWAEAQPDNTHNREFFTEMYRDTGLLNDITNRNTGIKAFIVEKKREIDKISIKTSPKTKNYVIGEELDTTGLSLKISYDDGESEIVKDGFTAKADLTTAGMRDVSVSYKGQKTKYSVTVSDLGDVNADGSINISDGVLLEEYLLGKKDAAPMNWKAADLNRDLNIDTFDEVMMRNLLVEESYSEWSEELPPSDALCVESRVEYRTAEKIFKDSETMLDSWTLESTNVFDEWSDYSTFDKTEVKESNTCRVKTDVRDEKVLIGYRFYYNCARNPSTLERWYFNGDTPPASYDIGYGVNTSDALGITFTISKDELASASTVGIGEWFDAPSGGYSGFNMGTSEAYYVPSHPATLWYKGEAVFKITPVTYYSYSTRTTKTVYRYSKVGKFSGWGTEKPAEAENTVVEERIVYRYIPN